MSVAIVDYNAGNLRSVQRACNAVGVHCDLVRDPDVLRRADRILFPGVGHAQSAMQMLGESGLGESLREAHRAGTPILGICVGAQLILERSEESEIPCLGLLKGVTRRFALDTREYKIPHIGWNEVTARKPHPLLEGLLPGDEFYFVHSYYPDPTDPECVMAVSDYGGAFCCALGKDNLFATQFHPEKSGPLGLALLKRFSQWGGSAC
jgi:imidazole glycerol-phosphate synthase subunit HisH